MIRTGDEYRQGLRDGREVWIDGERVKDVTSHPSFKPIVDVRARMYDMAHEAAYQDKLTYVEENRRNTIFYKPPRETRDWTDKVEAIDLVMNDIGGVVTRVGDETIGEVWSLIDGRDVLAALVCATTEPRQIAEALSGLVPPHMVPQIIVCAPRIPFTVGGKIDRAAVARELRDADVLATVAGYRAPATPLESALSSIVGEVLGRDSIGADDDFFSVGGDSVLATQVVARIRTWLDTPSVMVADIFATRTVSALAARMSANEPNSSRLTEVAALYLEVAEMENADVIAALESTR